MTETNSQNFDSLQERNQQVLNNISQLQTQEKELYDNLDDITLSAEQKQQIINKINEISQMRLNMYASMKDMYSFYQKDVSASRNTLGQEMSALDIMENELNEAKRRLNMIEEQKHNKVRLVEINTYYGKRYNAHSRLMKTIVIMCIPLIILAILANNGILPPRIYMLLVGVIIIVAVIVIGYQVIDMTNRDNMNWDEYNWYFNENDAPSTTDTSVAENPWELPTLTCVGAQCCYDNSTYDSTQNRCVPTAIYNESQAAAAAAPVDTSTDTSTTATTSSTPTTTTTSTSTTTSDPVSEAFKTMSRYGYTQVKATPVNSRVMPMEASLSKF